LTEQECLDRIAREFDVPFTTVQRIDKGSNHLVLLLDDRLLFRFPNTLRERSRLSKEVSLLAHIRSLVNVPVPDYQYVAADSSFGGYPLLRGEPLRPVIFQARLCRSAHVRICSQLGLFLKDLHSVPPKIVAQLQVPLRAPRDNYDSLLHDCATYLYPRMTEREIRKLEQFILTLAEADHLESRATLTHGDFVSDHILIDEACEALAGIIDFGDHAIADPASDFARLWTYGAAMVRDVHRSYGGEGDDLLLYRSFQYFRYLRLKSLVDANRSGWRVDRAFQKFRAAFSSTPKIVRDSAPPAPRWRPLPRITHGERTHLLARAIDAVVPRGALAVLIGKGDGLDVGGRRMLPFPEQDGAWGGYPADDAAAVAELERLHSLGASFIVVPTEMRYWLDAYPGLAAHLRTHAAVRVDNARVLLFEL
jgi:aminoglycoside 2''-phosphotransferase